MKRECANIDSEESDALVLAALLRRPVVTHENIEMSQPKAAGRWTREEHLLFLEGVNFSELVGLQEHGRKWSVIQANIPSRTASQIRAHAQKFFIKIQHSTGWTIPAIIKCLQSQPATYFMGLQDQQKSLMHEAAATGLWRLPAQPHLHEPIPVPGQLQRRKMSKETEHANAAYAEPILQGARTIPLPGASTRYSAKAFDLVCPAETYPLAIRTLGG